MAKAWWLGVLLLALLPTSAWALRCNGRIVSQGDTLAEVRARCGAPFFVDHFARSPGVGVDVGMPGAQGTVVTGQAWYYNFGPQRLMVRLDFSGGVLARERTLGYGFVGAGGPCHFTSGPWA